MGDEREPSGKALFLDRKSPIDACGGWLNTRRYHPGDGVKQVVGAYRGHIVDKHDLVIYLLNNSTGAKQAPATIATNFKVASSIVSQLKDEINADGIYTIQSGKGGGLSISAGPSDESDTYKYIKPGVEKWVSDNVYGRHGVTRAILESTHAKKLSGKWSTPDFSLLCAHKFLHMPGSQVEIISIEVKHTSKQFDVSCVYEALAHTRVSAYTILFFYDPPHDSALTKSSGAILEDIKEECARQGVGLVISSYPIDLACWSYLVPARLHSPDKRRVDAFIEEAYSVDQQKELKKLL